MHSATCMQLLFKIQIDLRTNRAFVSKGGYHSSVTNMHFTIWPPGVASNGCKPQKMPVCYFHSFWILSMYSELWLNSCSLHWILPTQSERLRWIESHWIRPSSLQKTSSTGSSAATRLMRWCWQIFHTHCRIIRSDAICFTAPKKMHLAQPPNWRVHLPDAMSVTYMLQIHKRSWWQVLFFPL